jgi:nitrate reductase molybdenum cofactor assembly chaperone NarJ/NarW
MQTYKVLSLLLQYPDQALMDSLDELLAILIDDALLTKAKINEIQQLIHYFQKKELLLLEENYVNLFDRNPRLSLHLFEHVHGDSRERGQAMVDFISRKRNYLIICLCF